MLSLTKRACGVTIIIITPRGKPAITKVGESCTSGICCAAVSDTDAVGAGQYNDKLSQQRAERVRAELVQRGLPEDNITVTGRGKRELLVPTADGVAEPENRRVEINVR